MKRAVTFLLFQLLVVPSLSFSVPQLKRPSSVRLRLSVSDPDNVQERDCDTIPRSVSPFAIKQVSKSLMGALAFLTFSFHPIISNGESTFTNDGLIPSARAATSTVVGSIKGSGLFFKDTLQIESFDDPKVKGVKLYISNFQIPVTERIGTGNFFSDPSYASVACARGAKVSIADNIARGPAGEEVFEESKSLLFKTLRVQRVYDEEANTVVYVSFNTRLDKSDDSNKSRFKSSLCAINLD
jgi:catabolite regulation protein CreA